MMTLFLFSFSCFVFVDGSAPSLLITTTHASWSPAVVSWQLLVTSLEQLLNKTLNKPE